MDRAGQLEAAVTPTLVIGVGSTGARILSALADRIYEEYLRPTLPVIRLLALVTDSRDSAPLSGKSVASAHITVPNMAVVRDSYDRPRNRVDRALRNWLPTHVLKHAGFENGSANTRAVGRLHLWQNYQNPIIPTITRARNLCTGPEARNASNRIIHRRLYGEDVAPREAGYVGNGFRVYIVGTLCGGTCSGMAVDLAYSLQSEKHIDANTADPIIGVFTVLDRGQASEEPELAANCRAGLMELNWFHHPRTVESERHGERTAEKELILPNGSAYPKGPPFDTLYVQSTSTLSNRTMINSMGHPDPQGLEDMIALKLFMDACAGVQEHVADMHLNNPIRTSTLDSRGRRPRALHSFGAAAMAHPKYRIATAAAKRLARDVITERWLSTTFEEERAVTAAEEDYRSLSRMVRSALGRSELKSKVEGVCRSRQPLNTRSAVAMRSALKTFPSDEDRLNDRFQRPDGTYYMRVNDAYVTHVREMATQWATECYAEQRGQRDSSLPFIERYLLHLEELLSNRKSVLEASGRPNINLEDPTLRHRLTIVERVERAAWLAALGVRTDAVLERKQHVMDRYAKLAAAAVRDLINEFEARAIADAIQVVKDLDQHVKLLMSKMRNASREHEDGHRALVVQLKSPPKNTIYLLDDKPGKVVESRADTINLLDAEGHILEELLDGKSLDTSTVETLDRIITNVDDEKLAESMLGRLRSQLLRDMRQEDVLETVERDWDAEANTLVHYAFPYVELNSFWESERQLPPGGETALVLAHGQGDGDQIMQATLGQEGFPQTAGGLDFGANRWQALALTQLDHQVIFYTEEPRFSTTFMEAFAAYEQPFKKLDQQSDGNPLWTDERWVATSGPQFDEWSPALDLMLRGAAEVFSIGGTAWDDLPDMHPPLFEFYESDTKKNHPAFSWRDPDTRTLVRIEVGDQAHYEHAIRSDVIEKIINALKRRIVDTARALGRDDFLDRAARYQRKLDADRAEAKDRDEWSKSDEDRYEDRRARFRDFMALVRSAAFGQELSDDETARLNELGLYRSGGD